MEFSFCVRYEELEKEKIGVVVNDYDALTVTSETASVRRASTRGGRLRNHIASLRFWISAKLSASIV